MKIYFYLFIFPLPMLSLLLLRFTVIFVNKEEGNSGKNIFVSCIFCIAGFPFIKLSGMRYHTQRSRDDGLRNRKSTFSAPGDKKKWVMNGWQCLHFDFPAVWKSQVTGLGKEHSHSVSYTHLTLPTILLV